MFLMFTFTICTSVPLGSCAAAVILPIPTCIERIQPNTIDSRGAKTRNIPQAAPVIRSKVEKVMLTNEQIEQFNIIVKKCMDGSITPKEAIFQLRGGELNWELIRILIIIIKTLTQPSNNGNNVYVDALQPIQSTHRNRYSFESQYPGPDKRLSSLQMKAQKNRNDYGRKYDGVDLAPRFQQKYSEESKTINRSINFDDDMSQIQKKYHSHKNVFNMTGNYNQKQGKLFIKNMLEYCHAPETLLFTGTYRKNIPVLYYYDPNKNIAVIVNATNNNFLTTMELFPNQQVDLYDNANIF